MPLLSTGTFISPVKQTALVLFSSPPRAWSVDTVLNQLVEKLRDMMAAQYWLPLWEASRVYNHWSYEILQFMALPFSRSTQISCEKTPGYGIMCWILQIQVQRKTAEFDGVISCKSSYLCSGINSGKIKVVDRNLQVHKSVSCCPVVTF